MSFNLTQMNLWLGLVRGDPVLPRRVFELGYREEAIEREFVNASMDRVCPELIIASQALGHSLIFEFKSGANTDADQLARYGRTENGDLPRAGVPPERCRTHDIVVVGKWEHRERLPIGVTDGGHPFPILLADVNGLCCVLNQFTEPDTDEALNPRLDVDWAAVPTSYFPFDQDSEPWEVAEAILPEMLEAMLQRERRVEFAQLCQKLTPWGVLGTQGRQQLTAKVSAVLHEAAQDEFSEFLTCDNGGVRIDQNPLDVRSSKRTAAFQALRRRLDTLIARLRDGGGQLRLDLRED